MANTILLAIDDLMFQPRVAEQARALGYDVVLADSGAALETAFDTTPALVVVDLHARGVDWRKAVERATESGAPVLAFGRHTEAALLREARDAGCARVVPRSTLVEELPQLIQELAGG